MTKGHLWTLLFIFLNVVYLYMPFGEKIDCIPCVKENAEHSLLQMHDNTFVSGSPMHNKRTFTVSVLMLLYYLLPVYLHTGADT